MPDYITVTAPEGRKVPVHPNDAAEIGGTLHHVEAPHVSRVRYSSEVRRAITRGDLIPCTIDGHPVGDYAKRDYNLEHAAAPESLSVGSRVTAAGGPSERPTPIPGKPRPHPLGKATTDASGRPMFDTTDKE